jgi:RNA polymerase sigma factor (sigma-70 family)
MEVFKKYNDAELLTAINSPADIDSAIKFIYRSCYDFLKTYTCANSGNDEDAQDIFQEVLVVFIELVHQNKFRGESTIKTFLYSLNRNIWLNELKKRGRTERRNTIYEKEKDVEVINVSQYMVQAETQKQIFSIVGTLGQTCKKILLAFYYENLSMKEIFKMVDYESEQAVRNKKYKCLKQLEQLLTNDPALARILKNALNHE